MNVSRALQMGRRRAVVLLGAFIVVAGFAVGLWSGLAPGLSGSFGASPGVPYPAGGYNGSIFAAGLGSGTGGNQPYPGSTQNVGVTSSTSSATTVLTSTTYGGSTQPIGENGGGYPQTAGTNVTSPGGTGALLEFSSSLSIQVGSPQVTAAQVVAMAYEVGGYVAYQATYQNQAEVVIRVPAAQYSPTLAKVEALGTVTSLTSNSNDVTVQVTDLNATLASLRTEASALLRLLNQSASVNTTLAIENSLQGVDAQINSIESQILQAKTLVSYSTIDVTISQTQETQAAVPLTMVVNAAPLNGTAPFSVTFNAIVKGGAQPYVVNYDFGDGTADQGQILIHTYYQPGEYKVTVTATDQNGTVKIQYVTVNVYAPPGQSGIGGFLGNVSNLFVSVVEGIVEVAVVVLPLAAVAAVVVLPFRKRFGAQKEVKQS